MKYTKGFFVYEAMLAITIAVTISCLVGSYLYMSARTYGKSMQRMHVLHELEQRVCRSYGHYTHKQEADDRGVRYEYRPHTIDGYGHMCATWRESGIEHMIEMPLAVKARS